MRVSASSSFLKGHLRAHGGRVLKDVGKKDKDEHFFMVTF